MRKQAAYRPGFEDWIFHLAFPAVSYALLACAAMAARGNMTASLLAVAASAAGAVYLHLQRWDAISSTSSLTWPAHTATHVIAEKQRTNANQGQQSTLGLWSITGAGSGLGEATGRPARAVRRQEVRRQEVRRQEAQRLLGIAGARRGESKRGLGRGGEAYPPASH